MGEQLRAIDHIVGFGSDTKYYSVSFELPIKQFREKCYESRFCSTWKVETRDEDRGIHNFFCYVYINDKSEKEYVSLMLRKCYTETNKPRRLTINCTISVKDIYGEMRFPQSFSFKTKIRRHHLKKNKSTKAFGIDKFISCECLENNLEFLPDGVLTLCICIFASHEYPCRKRWLHPDLQFQIVIRNHLFYHEGENLKVFFSSPEFQALSNYTFFLSMQNMPMKEAELQYMSVEAAEVPAFKNLITYLMNKNLEHLHNVEQLLALYVISDKYEIADLLDVCLTELKRNITSENAWVIYNISDMCSDKKLKKFTVEYIRKHPSFISTEYDDFFQRYFTSRKMLVAYFGLNKPLRNPVRALAIYILKHNIDHISSIEQLLEIYVLSKKYGITDLSCKCTEKLKRYLSIRNAYLLLNTAVQCGDEDFATFVAEHIHNHPESVEAKYYTVFTEDDHDLFENWGENHCVLNINDFIPVDNSGTEYFI